MKFVPGPRNIKILGDDDRPLRLQFNKVPVLDFNAEWKTVDLEIDPTEWLEIEAAAQEYAELPWKTNLDERRLRVKIDDRTMFFDSKSELIPGCQKVSAMANVTCIVEIKSVYNFKGQSGLTCRIHQLRTNEGCLL